MRTEHRTPDLDQLCRESRRSRLNLNPPYQRPGDVWSLAKKQLLIDSILREYDMPKFYHRRVEGQEPFEFEVVDGQQRTRAIFEFRDGGFALGETSADIPGLGDLSGKSYEDLPPEAHDRFGEYIISVSELEECTEEEVRELFLRLQEGASLTPAEKRNAKISGMRDFIASLTGTDGGKPNSVFLEIRPDNVRYSWDDWAAHTMLWAVNDGPCDMSAKSLMKMYESERGFAPEGAVAKRFLKTYSTMVKVLQVHSGEMNVKWGFVDLFACLWILSAEYAIRNRLKDISDAYFSFERSRGYAAQDGLAKLLEKPDPASRALYDYAEAFQREGNKKKNIQIRSEILLAHLLNIVSPEPKDPRRSFSDVERRILWTQAGRKCELCGASLEFSDSRADHIVLHADGGLTTLVNGRCLCGTCNSGADGQVTTAERIELYNSRAVERGLPEWKSNLSKVY